MRVSDLKKIKSGQKVYWDDNGSACARTVKVRSISINGNVASITTSSGSEIEAFARELHRKAPKTCRR